MRGLTDVAAREPDPVLSCRSPFISLPERALDAFCRRWKILGLRLVGSALRGPFRDDSDVDLVVRASIASPFYAAHGQLPHPDAVAELREIIGRKVDLICPRRTLASANPFSTYNLLVEHRFEREACHAWYLHSAAHLLSHAALPDPEASLAALPDRHLVLFALTRFARTCDSEARVAALAGRGLRGIPFNDVRAWIGPVVTSVRALERPHWPSDAILAGLIRQLAPHLTRIMDVTAGLLPPLPPEIRRGCLEEALVDPPVIWKRAAPSSSRDTPRLRLGADQLAIDRDVDRATDAAHRAWACLKLFVSIDALADRDGPSSPGEIVSLAPMHRPLYLTRAQIAPDARQLLAALAQQRGARLLLRQPMRVEGRRFLLYGVLVAAAFATAAS